VRVAEEEVAVPVDAQAAGPTVAVIGRGPAGAEELAVPVEHLDARREIDDVEAVAAVDGHRPGPDEIAVLHAAPAPDQFRLRLRPTTAGEKHQAEADEPAPA
jgi:hypothetical protein